MTDSIEVQRLKHKISYFKTEIRLLKKLLKENPRELSDEEIHEVWNSMVKPTVAINVVDFARAILRKASEK